MTNTLSSERVNFSNEKDVILAMVAENGDIRDLTVWKATFPNIEFMEVDEGLTSQVIDWETYSPTERAAYVAYMNDPQAAELDYRLEADGYKASHEIYDSERIWYCWFAHVMRFFAEGEKLTDEALETLLGYAAQGNFEELIMDTIDPEDVLVTSMRFVHKPVTR